MKLTQQNVADMIGTSRSSYALFELGNNSMSLTNFVKLVKVLNFSADEVLGIDSSCGISLTPQEWFMVENWRKLSKIDQLWLANFLKYYFGLKLGDKELEKIQSILKFLNLVDDVRKYIPKFICNKKGKDPEIDYNLNFTFNKAQEREVNVAISNTFGFGGHNACVVFKKYIG